MSGTGLRAIKDVALLDHLMVTPELAAKLTQAIETAEAQGPVPEKITPQRTWLRPAAYTGAAAAVLALALLAAPKPPAEVGGMTGQPVVPLPAPYQQGGSNTTFTVTANAMVAGTSYQVKLYDQAGNAVTTQAQTAPPQSPQTPTEAQPGRKIITNGEYALRVTDASAAMQRLEQEATSAGGYVAEASLNKEPSGAWAGRIVLRVPAARAASTFALLGQVGTVERQRQWTQDVSDQYMDLEHRIEILKEHEASLRQLADKAATFDDWNKLAGQINTTRVEIDNLTGKLKLLANQVDYAILNIQVTQPAPEIVPPQLGATTLSGRMGEAFVGTLSSIGGVAQRVVVGLAAMGPYLLALLLVTGGILLWYRRHRKVTAAPSTFDAES